MQAEQWIRRVAEGDGRALEKLYTEYSKMVFAVALSVTRSRADAEDVLSDTFVSVWQRAHTYRGGSGKSWLCAIARNLALTSIKKRGRENGELPELAVDFGIEGGLENKMLLELALSALDGKERETVLLHNAGYKHREIAEICEEKLGTVTWRYNNALLKMRKRLEEGV